MVEGEKTRFWIPEKLAYKGKQPPVRHARLRRRADQDQVGRPRHRPACVRRVPRRRHPPAAMLARALEAIGERAPDARRAPARCATASPAPGALLRPRRAAGCRRRPCRRSCSRPALPSASPPAASVGDSAASARRRRPAERAGELLDPPDERFHPLAVGVGIEIGAAERRGPPRDDGGRTPSANRWSSATRALAIDAARRDLLLPARRAGSDRGHRSARQGPPPAQPRARRRRTARALRARRRSPRARRPARRARCRGAARSARRSVAGAAEPLPDRLRAALLHRADRLPLGLQPLDLGGGGVPVGRLGERLGLRAERFLPREVVGPDRLALGQIGVAAGEEAIAGAAEPLPDRLLLAARHRADGLPLGLQRS